MPQSTRRWITQKVDELRNAPQLPFHDLLDPATVNQVLDKNHVSFRDRIFSPLVTLWTFLSQVLSLDHSCREAVARLIAFRVSNGQEPCGPETGSYCKARQRLHLKVITDLVQGTAQRLQEQARTPLALASWCAGSVIKRPCESVLAMVALGAHDSDAKRRVRHCVSRLPAPPRPVRLEAPNSFPGFYSAPKPPSRCISPPVCSQSITPPVAVVGSRGCTLVASPGTLSTPRPPQGSSPTPMPLSRVRSRHSPSLPTTVPAVPSRTRGDAP